MKLVIVCLAALSIACGVLGCTSAATPTGTNWSAQKTCKASCSFYMYEQGNTTGNPEYSIMSFSNKPVYDPGEEVVIDLYIAGSELVNQTLNQSLICHVPKYIVKGRTVDAFVFSFAMSKTGEWEGWKPVLPRHHEQRLPTRFSVELAQGYFTYVRPEGKMLWSESEIIDEKTGDRYPPISIMFVVDGDAPGGDHMIQFQFKYLSRDNEWLVVKDTLNIHIRGLIERSINILTILAAAAVALLTVLLSTALSTTAFKGWVKRHAKLILIVALVGLVIILAPIFWILSAFK